MSYFDTMEFNIDWLNGVLHSSDVMGFFEFLESLDKSLSIEHWFKQNSGRYNYKNRFCYNGQATLQIMWNALGDYDDTKSMWIADDIHHNPDIFVTFSGDGLRFLNSLGVLPKLFSFFKQKGFRASRFDVNCDIFEEDNPLVPLIVEAFRFALIRQDGTPCISTHVQRKAKNFIVYENSDIYHNRKSYSVQLGDHSTRFGMFRCYDKWLELKDGRMSGTIGDALLEAKGNPDYWYRLEYELHKENAADVFNAFLSGQLNVEGAFAVAADRIFKIVNPVSVVSRLGDPITCPDSPVWLEFMEYVIHFV